MKMLRWMFCLWTASNIGAATQTMLVERGPHHDTHESVAQIVQDGKTILRTNRYSVLQPGLNYLDNDGSYKPSSAQIDLAQVGAEYKRGPFKVKFAPNHNDPVASVDITLPDG